MSCWDTVQAYAFRSLGYGERLLPRGEITLCEQVTLIGSGLIWNVYFGLVALLTGFVFAAGYARIGIIDETPVEVLEEALHAMPIAFHRLARMLVPKLTPSRGRIVCISAFGAHRSKSYSYAATAPAKAGLEAQVRVYAANLAPRGITVNAVVPGFVEKEPGTPSSLTPAEWEKVSAGIPMNRIGRRDEIAAVAGFLLSEQASYITGQSIHVNGGLTL